MLNQNKFRKNTNYLGKHKFSIFDKIIKNDWSNLTKDELTCLACDVQCVWTRNFHAYIKRNNVDLNWPLSNSKKVCEWAEKKRRFEYNKDRYTNDYEKEIAQFEKNKHKYNNVRKIVSFMFDVDVEGESYDGYSSCPENFEKINKQITNKTGQYIHYYTLEHIKNNREEWTNELKKFVRDKLEYINDYDVRRVEKFDINLHNFIPLNEFPYNSPDSYDIVFQCKSLKQFEEEHYKKLERLDKLYELDNPSEYPNL